MARASNTVKIEPATTFTPAEQAALTKFELKDEVRKQIEEITPHKVNLLVWVRGEIVRHPDREPGKNVVWLPDDLDLVWIMTNGKPTKAKIRAILRRARANRDKETISPTTRNALKELIAQESIELFGKFMDKGRSGKLMGEVVFSPVGRPHAETPFPLVADISHSK